MSFTLATSGQIIAKAGAGVSSVISASGVFIANACDLAEDTFCMMTRKDWVTNYAGVDTHIKLSIANAVASLAGNDLASYDPDGYSSTAKYQTLLDKNIDLFNRISAKLEVKENQGFK